MRILIKISEKDDSQEMVKNEKLTSEFTHTLKTENGNSNTSEGTTTSHKVSIEFSNKITEIKDIKITTKKDSDNLGSAYITIYNPIISSDSEKYSKGYFLNSISTGTVEIITLPMHN